MWISQTQEAFPMEVAARKEDVLLEIAAIVKDVIQAMEEQGDDIDDEEVEAVGRITRELVVYVRSYKCALHKDSVAIGTDSLAQIHSPGLCSDLNQSSRWINAVSGGSRNYTRARSQNIATIPSASLYHPLYR